MICRIQLLLAIALNLIFYQQLVYYFYIILYNRMVVREHPNETNIKQFLDIFRKTAQDALYA